MYKPETQLVMNEIWAAAAAHKLGFEVETKIKIGTVVSWEKGFNKPPSFVPYEHKEQWRITVTESGPNAAERFLPQLDDLCDTETPAKTCILGLGIGVAGGICPETANVKIYGDAVYWRKCRRIIERNGTPFPQFSEVIEP
jgi:hypothetical protein